MLIFHRTPPHPTLLLLLLLLPSSPSGDLQEAVEAWDDVSRVVVVDEAFAAVVDEPAVDV